MKRLICAVLAAVMLVAVFASCTGTYDKKPDEYKDIRWINADYSFSIYPSKDCTGIFRFNGKNYNIKAEFEGAATVVVRDTSNKNARLFVGDWMYHDGDLYIYNVQYNTKDYKEFKTNYNEFFTLAKEKLEK